MSRISSVLRIVTAIALIVIVAILCWQCIDIYADGKQQVNGQASIFQPADVALRFRRFSPVVKVCLTLMLASCLLHGLVSIGADNAGGALSAEKCQRRMKSCAATVPEKNKEGQEKAKRNWPVVQIGLGVTAVVFIVLGVMNRGWYDVLVKAINICTECIGLG